MLALPAAAIAYGVYRLIAGYDESVQAYDNATAAIQRQMPTTGRYQPAHRMAQATHAIPQRVLEDRDLRGVPVWHVDYGNGSLHTSYAPPSVTHVPTFY